MGPARGDAVDARARREPDSRRDLVVFAFDQAAALAVLVAAPGPGLARRGRARRVAAARGEVHDGDARQRVDSRHGRRAAVVVALAGHRHAAGLPRAPAKDLEARRDRVPARRPPSDPGALP